MQPNRHRWFVFAAMFAFILLHQADKLLIGPLTTPIMEEFAINEAQMGLVFSGAIVVGAIFYPLWGYLYDRFARAKLLSLAALLWGLTTSLSATVRTYPAFLATRAFTGIDDSSYPGLYSLLADYFPPKMRGRVNGLLQIAMPMGYLVGMVLALLMADTLGWRRIFILTGALGILLAITIFFGVREPQRGASEPELQDLPQMGEYRFDWHVARGLLRNRSLLLLIGNGFFGVFPWQVITFWFFRYLETEREYDANQVLLTMVLAVLVLAAGYPIGGLLGDRAFRRNPRGRMWVSAGGAILGAGLLVITLHIPLGEPLLFGVFLCLTALFMPFASPNVISTVYDVTVPEVRSTACSLLNFFEQIGSSAAPALAGAIAVRLSLGDAILYICTAAWAVCAVFLLLTAYYVPEDIAALREQMEQRATLERARAQGALAE